VAEPEPTFGKLLVLCDPMAFERTQDVRVDLLLLLFAIDLNDQPASTIERKKWFGFDEVDLEPVRHNFLGVIVSSIAFGPVEQASHELDTCHIQVHHCLELDAFQLIRSLVCGFGLLEVPRESIEHVSAVTTRFDDWLGQDLEYQLIGYEVAASEILGGRPPNFSPGLDLLA
jgi:hypothetical protein